MNSLTEVPKNVSFHRDPLIVVVVVISGSIVRAKTRNAGATTCKPRLDAPHRCLQPDKVQLPLSVLGFRPRATIIYGVFHQVCVD